MVAIEFDYQEIGDSKPPASMKGALKDDEEAFLEELEMTKMGNKTPSSPESPASSSDELTNDPVIEMGLNQSASTASPKTKRSQSYTYETPKAMDYTLATEGMVAPATRQRKNL